MLGVDILRSGQEFSRNKDSAGNSNPAQVSLDRANPSPGPSRTNPTATVYTREFIPGATSQAEIDAIVAAGKDPNGLMSHAVQARRNSNEVGCRATSLHPHDPYYLPIFTINIRTTTLVTLPNGRTRVELTGWDNLGTGLPLALNRDFKLSPIQGSGKTTTVSVRPPQPGVPDSGRILEISESPIGIPADGSMIVVSPMIMEYGASGWQPISSTISNPIVGTHSEQFSIRFRINSIRGAVVVMGQFFRVKRDYTPITEAPNGVCPIDPRSCNPVASNSVFVNLCSTQNTNVGQYLAAITQPTNQRRLDVQAHDTLRSSLAVNRAAIAGTNPTSFADGIMHGSRSTLAGYPPQPANGSGFTFNMTELFPGCSETRTTRAYASEGVRREAKYESCVAAIDPAVPRTCNGRRSVGFTSMGTQVIAKFTSVRNTKTASCPANTTYTDIPPVTWNDPNTWNRQARSFTYSSCPADRPHYIGQADPVNGIFPPVTYQERVPLNATTWGPWYPWRDDSKCSADVALATLPRTADQPASQVYGYPGRQVCMPGEITPLGSASTLSTRPFTGDRPFDFAVFGAPEAINSPTDPNPEAPGTFDFWQIEYRRLALDPNAHFAHNIRVQPVGAGTANATITTIGEAENSWRVSGTANLSNVTEFEVIADIYMVPVNEITGCDAYIKLVADRYCTVPPPGQLTCTDNRGPCTTLNGVNFCNSGATAGIAKLLKPWGTTDSARIDPATNLAAGLGGGPIELLNNSMCFAATGPALACNLDAQSTGGWRNNFPTTPVLNGYVDNCHLVKRSPDDGSAVPTNALLTDPACRIVDAGTRCQGESVGVFSGTCYNREIVYDCGRDVPVPPGMLDAPTVTLDQSCSGGTLRCLGTDCHAPAPEANPNFAMMAAAGEIVSAVNQHTVCEETGNPPASDSEPCTPTVFGGKKRTCSFPVTSEAGIGQHCCRQGEKAAAGVNMLKWVTMLKLAWKLQESQFVMNTMRQVGGTTGLSTAYESVGSSVSSISTATTQWFTDAFQSIAGSFGWSAPAGAAALPAATPQVANVAIEGAAQGLSQFNPFTIIEEKIRSFATDALANVFSAAASSSGQQITQEAARQQATQAVNFVQNVLFWYSVAQLVGNLIYDCDKEELSTGMERKSGNDPVNLPLSV
ncbi:MAG: hypothetical protein EAZ30_17280 [Betaproteobacteria bacterium]|nr:MAG: hypothetical protein EAZ30_17280 [Betaproteobacteria bacterium]